MECLAINIYRRGDFIYISYTYPATLYMGRLAIHGKVSSTLK